ncbi:MAG: signal recognition particle-docking protein FtsY [Alphaproteobacteria bacterium]|nr:signal recognition particle-docking protein FtsY [Alphaproteobacteria bacterium]
MSMGWLDNLRNGMKKTAAVFKLTKVDWDSLEELEEALLRADTGYTTTDEIVESLKKKRPQNMDELKALMREEIIARLTPVAKPLQIDTTKKPYVILMTGVNGAGKTTTIGKLGQYYKSLGFKVSFVAADTFRAGATEQLQEWGKKIGCPVYSAQTGADAAGLVFDAIKRATEQRDDILLVDTAGRLHNKTDLMNELAKIVRVMKKVDESAPHSAVLVLDATVGQNAIVQVKAFKECASLTGLILTKLDGTAKGGILLALTKEFGLPIHAIGVGERAEDLHDFTAEQYVISLLGD